MSIENQIHSSKINQEGILAVLKNVGTDGRVTIRLGVYEVDTALLGNTPFRSIFERVFMKTAMAQQPFLCHRIRADKNHIHNIDARLEWIGPSDMRMSFNLFKLLDIPTHTDLLKIIEVITLLKHLQEENNQIRVDLNFDKAVSMTGPRIWTNDWRGEEKREELQKTMEAHPAFKHPAFQALLESIDRSNALTDERRILTEDQTFGANDRPNLNFRVKNN